MPTEATPVVPMTLVAAGIGRPFGFSGLYLVILEALRTVRNEALEEAAKVAEHEESLRSGSQTFPCIAIAAVIRSLKESP